MARSRNNLALLYSLNGDPAKAAAENEQVVPIFYELMNRFPNRLDFLETYCGNCGNQGKYLAELERFEESITWNTMAIEGAERVLAIAPNHTEANAALHGSLIGRAGAYRRLGHMDQAIEDYRRSLTLSEGQTRADYVNFRPRALAFVGEHRQAAAAAEAIVANPKATPQNFSEMAKVHATCSLVASQDARLDDSQRQELSARYAVRCVELLSQAAEQGRFPTLEDVAELKKDDRLSFIKDREDFQQLVAGLEAKLQATP